MMIYSNALIKLGLNSLTDDVLQGTASPIGGTGNVVITFPGTPAKSIKIVVESAVGNSPNVRNVIADACVKGKIIRLSKSLYVFQLLG